ncbi:hypothetical protein EDD21DRAFT_91565 [Dissophora ornata]|nr:hypothetical protein EDD21DRAFT_91565 [Dissophora ornata]
MLCRLSLFSHASGTLLLFWSIVPTPQACFCLTPSANKATYCVQQRSRCRTGRWYFEKSKIAGTSGVTVLNCY